MPNTEAVGKNENPAYYMMNMPEWFFELPIEKKIQLAKNFTNDSPNDKPLTKEDILKLLQVSESE